MIFYLKWRVAVLVLLMIVGFLDVASTLIGVTFFGLTEQNPLGITIPTLLKLVYILVLTLLFKGAIYAREHREQGMGYAMDIGGVFWSAVFTASWGQAAIQNFLYIFLGCIS